MAEEDQDQKTEYPTGKRLDEARERGQLPISREVGYLASLIGILIVINWLGPDMVQRLIMILRVFLESPHAFVVDDHGLQTIAYTTIVQVALASGLIFLVMAALGVLGFMVQTGFFASTQLITPDFGKLSPLNGLKRLFSLQSLVELGKSFGKLVILGLVVFSTLYPLVSNLPAFTGRPLMDSVGFLHKEAVHLIIVLMLVFAVIAFGDMLYQRYTYIKNLKMTKTEVKDEYKQQEGDPMIKGRLRQMRLEKARKRMMAQVPKADVVITNPTHYAVALKYDSSKAAAPVVLAKGTDRIAERIREVAEENKITLVSNPPLARALYDTVDIDKEIPTQHYRAVAEIISYVYKLKKKKI
jgi:flagellar biosynthetic protein FlhB